MNFFNKSILFIHRFCGTIMALFFAMWFLTGLVMIYHPYPRVSDEMKQAHMEALPDSLPSLDSLSARVKGSIKSLAVHQQLGQTLIEAKTKGHSYTLCADTLETPHKINAEAIQMIASRWVPATPVRIDTIQERQQWVLYERFESEMPMLHFTYDDKDKTELYMSPRTGEVHQLTTRSSRFWAWVGSIPHKIYIPSIRRNLDTWKIWINCGGFFCFLTAFTGLYIGLLFLFKHKIQSGRWGNPFKKFLYRWHEGIGLFLGLFMILWGISGAMIMERIPQWMSSYKGDYTISASKFWGRKSLPLKTYKLDYRKLSSICNDMKQITWTHFGSVPVYAVVNADSLVYIDASGKEPQPVNVSADEILDCVVKVLSAPSSDGKVKMHHSTTMGKDMTTDDSKDDKDLSEKKDTTAVTPVKREDCTIRLINHYDEYYFNREGTYPLPVYRVDVNNADGSRFYVSPRTGEVHYTNHNRMTKKWLVSAIHTLNIEALLQYPLLWTVCIWLLCLGGAFVSLTGFVMGLKWLKRNLFPKKKIA